jgi:hypothetical protein
MLTDTTDVINQFGLCAVAFSRDIELAVRLHLHGTYAATMNSNRTVSKGIESIASSRTTLRFRSRRFRLPEMVLADGDGAIQRTKKDDSAQDVPSERLHREAKFAQTDLSGYWESSARGKDGLPGTVSASVQVGRSTTT